MRFGSLFAGIGGFDLGFERAGMECAWQVEIDPYCQKVLAKHWPNVRRHDDIRTFPPTDAADWRVDCICGGFPCQDISVAGKGAGLDGTRSGLWFEYLRVIRSIRPRFVVVENVPAIFIRGFDIVLGGLADSGFDAEWSTIPAAGLGAPHKRSRLFIVAYANGERLQRNWNKRGVSRSALVAAKGEADSLCGVHAWRTPYAELLRVDDGIPPIVDRIRTIGNAVVPQVAEWIGRRLMEANDAKG